MSGTKLENLPEPFYEIEAWWMKVWNDYLFMQPNIYEYLKDLGEGEINEELKNGFRVMMKYSRDNQPQNAITPMQQKAKNNREAERKIMDFMEQVTKEQKQNEDNR
jgi:hypothetical protein